MVNATGAPSAYPFLSFFFLMAGGKKSRDGDAVGRRAERAGVRRLVVVRDYISFRILLEMSSNFLVQ
jgi:hypothetical protein